MKKWIAVTILCCLFAASCQKVVNNETGEEQYKLDPNTTAKVEAAAEGAIGAGQALAAFFPWLIPFVTAGAGAFAAWKKVKPQLETAQNKEALYYNSTDSMVKGIEAFKKSNPEDWKKLKAFLKVTPETENAIRALRGLPHIKN